MRFTEPDTITKGSVAYLKAIIPDSFIQNFIVDLIGVYAYRPNKHKKFTKNEATLYNALKKIELANALMWKFTSGNATDNTETEDELASTSPMPALHLINEAQLKKHYQPLSRIEAHQREPEIFSLIIDYEQLDAAAYNIARDHNANLQSSGRRKKTSSHITKTIYQMVVEGNYSRRAFVKHIADLNETHSMRQAVVQNFHEIYNIETTRLEDKIDQLNETMNGMKLQNETLNITVARLNESVIHYQKSTTDPSFTSTQSTAPILNQNKYIANIRKKMGLNRWNCIMHVVRYLPTIQPPFDQPLEKLLAALLTPSTEFEFGDTTIEEWLAENTDPAYETLRRDLAADTTLPPFPFPEDIETYYQSLAFCFSKGIFFPRLVDLAKKFNALRPSKQRRRAEEEVAVGDVAGPVASPAASP